MPVVVRRSSPWDQKHAMAIIRVYSDSAGTGYVNVTSLFRVGSVNLGIQCQSRGASVTPSFTMEDSGVVEKDPTAAGIPWFAGSAVAASAIATFPYAATYMRVVFAGAGEFTIGAV